MIRPATSEDTARVVEMAQRFVAETEYSDVIALQPDRVAATVERLIANPDATVLLSGSDATITGMIAMLAYDHPFSGERTAFEVVWWVEPEARGDGLRLLRAAEEWARGRGATAVQMVAPSQRVGELYIRLGYAPVETSFQRRL
jgi:GNAT superfamily N-acetyltransferase